MRSVSETWRKVDELSAAYSRLAGQRAAVWSQVTRYRMDGNKGPAAVAGDKLAMLDRQGLALAERIDDLCAAALGSIDETPRF